VIWNIEKKNIFFRRLIQLKRGRKSKFRTNFVNAISLHNPIQNPEFIEQTKKIEEKNVGFENMIGIFPKVMRKCYAST
jgi:hypothetical protein